jgi:hypothetical protein
VASSQEQRLRAGVPYSPARRVCASPKRDSGTPMRSIKERYRLRSLRARGLRMSSEADGRSIYHWTTLRCLVDPQWEITASMGVILWSEEEQRRWFRLPREGERLPTPIGCAEVPVAPARACLEITRAKLEGWLQWGELPYRTEPHPPLFEGWWEQARRLLRWRVRLGPIHSLVSRGPEADLEQLYQAFVQPLPATPEAAAWPESAPATPAAD